MNPNKKNCAKSQKNEDKKNRDKENQKNENKNKKKKENQKNKDKNKKKKKSQKNKDKKNEDKKIQKNKEKENQRNEEKKKIKNNIEMMVMVMAMATMATRQADYSTKQFRGILSTNYSTIIPIYWWRTTSIPIMNS